MANETNPGGSSAKAVYFFAALLAAAVATGFLLWNNVMPREAAFMAGIFVLAAILWITEALPLFATALLVIGLQAVLLANPGGWRGLGFESGDSPPFRQVVNSAVDPVLLLFFGGLMLAQAAVKEGVDKAMSSLLLRPFGGRPIWILLGLMLVTAVFSMWMSNTATTAMMITLVAPMLAQLPPGERFRKAMVLCVPFAANIGGIGTPIASPPNAVAIGHLQKSGQAISFLEWMLVAVPLMLGLILFAWMLLWRFYKPAAADLVIEARPHRLSRRGWLVVAIFAITVALWLSDRWHGLPSSVVALFPVVAFTASGILNRTDLNTLEWNVLILIAGGISLGAGMQMTGLDQIVVNRLPAAGDGNSLWLLAILVLATVTLGTFMSNTAAANIILPIGISAAMAADAAGLEPVRVAMSIALAASMCMALPVSTPPNAIAYSRGEFSTRDMARCGLIIGAVAVALIVTFGGMVMRLWGLL